MRWRIFESGFNGFKRSNCVPEPDYLQAIGHTANSLQRYGGQVNPVLAKGKTLIDLGADMWEAHALFAQQTQLLNTQFSLWQQLLVLQGKDPESLAKWESILKALYGDPEAQQQAFLKWLAANGLSERMLLRRLSQMPWLLAPLWPRR